MSGPGSPPLCYAGELPPYRSGNLVLTCTGLSVSPQAMLSLSQLHPHLFFHPSAFGLFVFPHVLYSLLSGCSFANVCFMFSSLPRSCCVVSGLTVLMQNDN